MIPIKMYCRELSAVVLGLGQGDKWYSKHIRPGIPTALHPNLHLSIDNYLHIDGHEVLIVCNGLVGFWSK